MLLALSGGADSRLLLHLCADRAGCSGAPLHLCHVHHGIRGAEADRDEAFCRALAKQYDLPLYVLHVNVPAIARETGETPEQAARRVRYDYFAALMREHRIPILLTAHHATDNLETLLFRLCRGTGLAGLGGIAPVRPFEDIGDADISPPPVVVRPLLAVSRDDILAACEQLGLNYVTDTTNADPTYARNRIRIEVLPALNKVTDHPEQQALRLCASLREDEDCLHALAVSLAEQACRNNSLCRDTLAAAHPAVAKRVLRLWLYQNTKQLPEAVQLEALLALCRKGGTSHAVSLGNGYVVRADRTHLHLCDNETQEASVARGFRIDLHEGEYEHPALGLRVCFERIDQHTSVTPNSNRATNVYNPFIRDTLTFDTIISCAPEMSLYLRSRDAGDVLLYHGMHRKLRKLQNEHGIPPALRDRLPLLCDNDGVLWAPAIGLRDGVLTPATHRLTLTLTPRSYHIEQ